MLWIALHFRQLALDVFVRGQPPDALAEPLAVGDRLQVLHPNAAARALGVHPRLRRATALALAPHLRWLERDEAAELEALKQVAAWALQFTPSVSLQAPDGVLLEVAASLRLFGGRQKLLARIADGIAQLGFDAGIATASTATAAWLLAQAAPGSNADETSQLEGALAALPVSVLASARASAAALEAVGARRLRDLMQLPRAGLARRFGQLLLDELDLALGRQSEARRWFEAPLQFRSRLELLAQVEHADALLFGGHRLLVQMCGWLAARQAAVRELLWIAEHDDTRHAIADTRIALRLTDASRDPQRIAALLRERLAAIRLPAPVHTLHLECAQVLPMASTNHGLFPNAAPAGESLARLIERLQARLGREQVQRVLPACDHRPEVAYRFECVDSIASPPEAQPALRGRRRPRATRSAAEASAARMPDDAPDAHGADAAADAVALAVPRPLWLLHEPVALGERHHRPWWRGPLRLLTPPERIEGGWWDGRLVQRDYFIAENEHGEWFWIFRTRHPDSGRGWFLQGFFG